MKTLVGGLYLLFVGLLASTIWLAAASHEGLVEEDYFRRATGFLSEREREKSLGLVIRLPDRLDTGRTRVAAVIATSDGPLRGAEATLRAMRLSGTEDDQAVRLREEAPGTYASDIRIPAAGRWMLDISVDSPTVRARRRWFATAEAAAAGPAAEGTRAGADLHQGAVTASAGGQAVLLGISPRPVRAMTALSFEVELPGYDGPGAPRIDLAMPGMRMPPNSIALSRGPDGKYRGTGVIVRCGSGMRSWVAAVTTPAGSTAEFPFDVAD